MYGHYGMYGLGGFGLLSSILFWLAIAFVVVVLVRSTGGQNHDGYEHKINIKTPIDILKERYAKGEIDKKEFEEKKKDLKD
jgi:putative membrane protein